MFTIISFLSHKNGHFLIFRLILQPKSRNLAQKNWKYSLTWYFTNPLNLHRRFRSLVEFSNWVLSAIQHEGMYRGDTKMSPFSLIDISLPPIVFFTAPSIPSQHLTMLIMVLLLMSFMSWAISWSHTFSSGINFRFVNNFKLRSLVLFLSALKGAVKRFIQCLITFCP